METAERKEHIRGRFKGWIVLAAALLFSSAAGAQELAADAAAVNAAPRYLHRIGSALRGGWVPPSNRFVKGENLKGKKIDQTYGVHLKYSFQAAPGTIRDRIYGAAYQGIGLGGYTFLNQWEVGDPLLFYIFQGARIGCLNPKLSVNYEWQFGLSSGWHPRSDENFQNIAIGSSVNAYLGGNVYLNWTVVPQLDLTGGVSVMHFSNGNTRLPNAGINGVMLTVGATAYFNRQSEDSPAVPSAASLRSTFQRHFSHDLLLFGSVRRKGLRLEYTGKTLLSTQNFNVWGASWATMYNFDYRFRAGMSLDGVYDASANIRYDLDAAISEDDSNSPPYLTPPVRQQMALGASLRGDFVMPYFTVSAGLGYSFLASGDDLASFYQTLALKVDITRQTYLNIGYRLKRFRTPNFLMLGLGLRFNNQPQTYRR
jgi:hypothetical protein